MEGREQGSKKSQPLYTTFYQQPSIYDLTRSGKAILNLQMSRCTTSLYHGKNKQNKTGNNKETNGILPFLYHVFV